MGILSLGDCARRTNDCPETMDQIHDFNFGYDVTKDSRRVLASADGDAKS